MRPPIFDTVVLLLTALLSGCSTTDDPESAPAPSSEHRIELTASVDEPVCETGKSCSVRLAIEERSALRDSCLLQVRTLQGNASVLLDDTPILPDAEIAIPYAVVNKAASTCVANLAIVPEAAATVEQTIRIAFAVSSFDRSIATADTVLLRSVNPAPIEVRAQYDRKPLLTTETMDIEVCLTKANFTGSYIVVFTHTAGQGFCDGDYTITEGDAFAVSAEQASFRLAYHPTASGEHRLRFTVSDGRYEQVVEIGCKAYRPESMELPADGVYIHTRNYEGAAFHTLEAWETSEESLSSEVDGIAFIDGERKVLLPLHALDALPFCGPDDRFASIPEFLTVSHFDGAERSRNVHRALLEGTIASAPAVEACYGYEPDYPGRWYLPDIRLLEELAYRFDMEPIRACMQRVGGTLFLTNDTSYLSCSVKCDEVLLTYDYYEFIIAEGRYGKRSTLYKDRPCPFFPVRDL